MTFRQWLIFPVAIILAACSPGSAPDNAGEAAIEVAEESAAETMTETPDAPDMVAGIGPVIGEAAPAVSVVDGSGSAIDFASLSGREGTIIAFTRSAEWCPYCQKQMRELETIKDELAAQGWTLAALTYDDPEILAEFASEEGITYPLMSDTDSQTIRAFSLLNTEMVEGTKYFGIPHPALVFIGVDGTIKAMLREDGYKTRPSNEVVLAKATELSN